MSLIAILADDLSGASASAGLLRALGLSSYVSLGLEEFKAFKPEGFQAVILNTASRLLPPQTAGRKVREAGLALRGLEPKLWGKRIDSTLRGNLGAEIEAGLDVLGPGSLALLVAAHPASGRVCAGGNVLVHGVALEQTQAARDPASPARSSNVAKVVSAQTGLKLAQIELATVLAGPSAVRQASLAATDQGARILIFDACSLADLDCLAQAFANDTRPLLAVCPGPFCAALAKAKGFARTVKPGRALLLLAGSASLLGMRQIAHLRENLACVWIKADAKLLVGPDAARESEIARLAQELDSALERASLIGLSAALATDDLCSLPELAAKLKIAPEAAASRISGGLALAAARFVIKRRRSLAGIYASGGETALALAQSLEVKGLEVQAEVLPLAALSLMRGGPADGLKLLTKGGLVGAEDSLTRCVKSLLNEA